MYESNYSPSSSSVRNGSLTLNVGRYGQLAKVSEFCFLFMEQPDYSAYNEEWVKLMEQQQSQQKKPLPESVHKS